MAETPQPPLVPVASGAPSPGRERKTSQRGMQTEFRIGFVDKATKAPMIPLDATKYPKWGIYSPSGVLVDSGVMQQYGEPGMYRVLWTVPVTAELSSDKGAWIFMTNFVNSKRKQFQNSMDFDVRDKQTTSSGNTDLIEIGVEGMPYRAIWRGDFEPSDLYVQMFCSSHPDTPNLAPIYEPLGKAYLKSGIDGDSLVYYIDVPGNKLTRPGEYTVLWTFRETEFAPQSVQYAQYRVVKRAVLQYLPELRFATERLPLDPRAPQKIKDSDLMEALVVGMRDLNTYHPVSSYSIDSIPSQLKNLWMMCAMKWMFHSQHLVLSAQAFNFGGATTSLDFDQTSAMDAAISRIDGWLQAQVTPAKVAVNRMLTANGALGLRPSRPVGLNTRVIRYESTGGSGNDGMVIPTLATLGLLP